MVRWAMEGEMIECEVDEVLRAREAYERIQDGAPQVHLVADDLAYFEFLLGPQAEQFKPWPLPEEVNGMWAIVASRRAAPCSAPR
jgi:hypothetical protein